MGVEPPFLYDPPSKYSFSGPTDKGFNPRTATHASWTPTQPKPKKNGPLIEFNRHPDSYLIVPYGNTSAKPMSPRTKSKVARGRQIQLALRICALLGAIGLLVCVIAIKGTSGSVGWIIRVAPGVAVLHTVYAIYHLCRSPTGRTPASSASYMLFAAMVDTGLIPFLVFTALMSRSEYNTGEYGWSTLFNDEETSHKIFQATFLLSATDGGIAVISLILGLYLAIVFRQIVKLPPDMNPLEDNLTARPHKRKKSELTVSDKHMSQTTLASSTGNRNSDVADPLISPTRSVPFMHTRMESTENLPTYRFSQPNSQRSSRADLRTQQRNQVYQNTNLWSFQSSSKVDLPSQQANVGLEIDSSVRSSPTDVDRPVRSSPIEIDRSMVPAPLNHKSPSRPTSTANSSSSTPSRLAQSRLSHQPTRSSTLKENWISYPSPSPSPEPIDENVRPVSPPSSPEYSPERSDSPISAYVSIKDWYTPSKNVSRKNEYESIEQHDRRDSLYDFERDLASPPPRSESRPVHPLGMNPPTPKLSPTPVKEPRRVALTDGDINLPERRNDQERMNFSSRPTMGRPSSFVGSGGKTRFYGDLQRGLSALSKSGSIGKAKGMTGNSDTASNYSTSTYETLKVDDDEDDVSDSKGRVISNSGVDIGSYAGLGPDFGRGMGRRRDVSGKVVEEGRALMNTPKRGEGTIKGTNGGAAGWARWKGM